MIHVVFVPVIMWAFMVWLCHLPFVVLLQVLKFNIPFGVAFGYILYYLLLDPVAGLAISPFILLLTYSAYIFALKNQYSWLIAGAIQIVAWSAQITGHQIFEKRTPAFLDNFFQSFLLAPLFVFMEILFAFGYRPALRKRVNEKVKASIQAWKLGNLRRKEQ